MFNYKVFLGMVLASALALQIGLSVRGGQEAMIDTQAAGEVTAETPVINDKGGQKAVMDGFNALLSGDAGPAEVASYINSNISLLSKENASTMVGALEEVQKKYLPVLDEKFYGDSVQSIMRNVYGPGFDINKIDGVEDTELKALLAEARDSGYKVETAEGMYFLIMNYEAYKKYSSYVTADIKDYIDIMAIESGKVPAKDAALVISWEEVLKRALNQERFISQYPDSAKINDMEQLYKKYVSFTLCGANNTPLFSYETGMMSDSARTLYMKAAESNENSKLLETLRVFLDTLKAQNYRLTDEVVKYRESVLKSL